MQILRSTPAVMELFVYSAGDLTDLDALPILAVTDANGDAVAGIGAVSNPAVGIYRANLPGQADLKTVKAVWSGELATSPVEFIRHYEIVGNLLFLEAEARAKTITGAQAPLSDESAYPDSDIARMRKLITDQFEQRTGRSWIRRYCRLELAGTGSHRLDLWDGHPRDAEGTTTGGDGRWRHIAKVISASVDGTAVDVANLRVDGRALIRTDGVWNRPSIAEPFNIIVEYEYGPDPVPYEANENGLRMALSNLVPSDVSAFATSFTSEDGTVSFSQGLNYPTRVWEWLKNNPPLLMA